jgi:HAD superfamily hydrolase (TIGR01549 family)
MTGLEKFEALLFDLDGTLVDSMAIHNQAWIAALKNVGCPMTIEILTEYAGIPGEKTVELFNQRFGWSLDPDIISADKESRFLKNIAHVKPIESVLAIARHYRGVKPMAIVSGGTQDLVARTLNAIHSSDIFTVRVCAGDIPESKPSPKPFLYAAQLLKVNPEKCLVFEDGHAGIQGAKAAGMKVMKVESDFSMNLIKI